MSQTAVIPKATRRMRPTAVVSKMGTTHSMIGRAHRRLVALLDSTPTRLRSVISTASVTDTHTSSRDASTKPDAPSIFRWFPAIESAFLWSITGTPNLKFVRACAPVRAAFSAWSEARTLAVINRPPSTARPAHAMKDIASPMTKADTEPRSSHLTADHLARYVSMISMDSARTRREESPSNCKPEC